MVKFKERIKGMVGFKEKIKEMVEFKKGSRRMVKSINLSIFLLIALLGTAFGVNNLHAQASGQFTITFEVDSNLGTLSLENADQNSPNTLVVDSGTTFANAGKIIVIPKKNYEFLYWVCKSDSREIPPADFINVVITENETYTAMVKKKSYINGEKTVVTASNFDPLLEMSKNAVATNKPNEFIITLNVNTKKEITTIVKAAASVALVLDVSSSMDKSMDGTTNGKTRFAALKEAAKAFVDDFFKEDASEENELAIVLFSDSSEIPHKFSVGKGKTLSEKKDAALLIINKISISFSGGTNINSGLREAKDELEHAENANKYLILFSDGLNQNGYKGIKAELTDEILSYEALKLSTEEAKRDRQAIVYDYRITEFDYTPNTYLGNYELPLSDGNKRKTLGSLDSQVISLISEALIIRKKGVKIYTILSLYENDYELNQAKFAMINIAGREKDFYLANDTAKLIEDFKKINSEISKEITLSMIKDPMSSHVDFAYFLDENGNPLINADGTAINPSYIHWDHPANNEFGIDLKTAGLKPKIDYSQEFPFSYSISYVIKLAPSKIAGFDENNYYETNGTTSLHYTYGNEHSPPEFFNVPSVSGTKIADKIKYTGGIINAVYGDGFLGKTVATATVAESGTNITYSLKTGSTLPAGLTLNSDGTITGNANATTETSFIVIAASATGGVAEATWTIKITKASLTITANNKTKTYGELVEPQGTEFTTIGLIAGEVIGSVTLTSDGFVANANANANEDAVKYDITASDPISGTGFIATNYEINYIPGKLTVNKEIINGENLMPTAENKVYDGNTDAKGLITLECRHEHSGKVSITADFFFVDKNITVGGVDEIVKLRNVKLTGEDSNNYYIDINNIESISTKARIFQAPLTIKANDASKTFGAELVLDGTTEFTTNGLIAGEAIGSVTLTSDGTVESAAQGTYNIVASAAVAGTGFIATNYEITYAAGTLTVSAKDLSGFSVEKLTDVVYNGENQELKPVVKDGETTLILGTDYTLAYTTDTKNVGEVTVTITGKGNYSGKTQAAYNITKATLIITADNKTKTYGELVEPLGTEFTTSGLIAGEVIGSVTLTSDGTVESAAQGTYDIVASAAVAGTGFIATNYEITYTAGTLTVSTKSINPEVNTQVSVGKIDDVVYNGENQKLEPVVKDGEKVLIEERDYTLSYTADTKNVGEVTVIITGKGNYSGETQAAYNITKATLTIKAKNASKTFGAELVLDGTTEFTTNGLITDEVIGSVTLASDGTVESAAQGTYEIVASAATGGTGFIATNYEITYDKGTLTVSTKSINPDDNKDISVGKIDDVVYNGENQKLKPVVKDGEKVLIEERDYTLSYTADTKNVGEVTVIITGKGNYSGETQAAYNITKAPLTITANDASKTFGNGLVLDGTEFTTNGLITDEVIGSVTLASDGTVESAAQGTYDIVASAATGGTGFIATNYEITYAAGTLTVSAKDLSGFSVEKLTDVVYNGENQELKPVVTDGEKVLIEERDYTLSYTADTKNVGEVTVIITGKGNYSEKNQAAYNITKATLTIKAKNASKTFGAELVLDGTTEFTTNGLIAGEAIGSVTLTSDGTVESAAQGTYDIVASAATGGTGFIATNYEITYTTGTLTVSTKSINPEVNTQILVGKIDDVVYNGENQKLEPVVKDGETTLILGTDYTLAYTTDTKNVGEVTVTITGKGNYSGKTQAAYNITKATLIITAKNASKTFGAELVLDGTTEFTTNGLIAGEVIGSVTLTSDGTVESAAQGTYDIVASAAVAGTGFIATNYEITYAAGTLTVSTKSINPEVNTQVSVGKIDDVVYNGENQELKPVVKDGEKVLIEERDYTLSYTADTKNVGEVTVIITGKGNYSGETQAAYNITKATLTIKAKNASKTFGAELVLDGTTEFTTNGLIAGEAIGSVTLTSDGTVESAAQGTYDIVASAATGGTDFIATNYEITYTTGTLTVSAKDLSGFSVEKLTDVVYNGENQELKPVVKDGETTLILGTDYTLTYTADTKNVGEVTVTITGKGNYSGKTQAAYNITKASLTITANDASKTFGAELVLDGTTEFTTNGLIAGEAIESVTLASDGIVESAAQGTYDIVASAAVAGTDFIATNYEITYAAGALTVSAKDLSGFSVEKLTDVVYNGENQELKPVVKDGETTLILGTDYTLTYTTDTKNVGEVTVTITGINNYYSGVPKTIAYDINSRVVTITSQDANKEYNGDALTNTSYDVENLVEGEGIESVEIKGSQTYVGESANTIGEVVFNNLTLSKNYTISRVEKKLVVTPSTQVVTIKSKDAEKIYDGEALVNKEYEISGLHETDRAIVTITGSRVGYGESLNIIEKVEIENNKINVNDCYKTIEREEGSLKVGKRRITVKSVSADKSYDGTPLKNAGYKIISGELLDKHHLHVDISASLTDVGQIDNKIDEVSVFDGIHAEVLTLEELEEGVDDNDLTVNYEIITESGILKVNKVAIGIVAASASKPYDGLVLTDSSYSLVGEFVAGEGLESVKVEGSQTDIGSSDNEIKEYNLIEGTKEGNYNIITSNGILTIIKDQSHKIVITANSAQKVYDGTPLTCKEYTIVGSVAAGDAITVETEGEITNFVNGGVWNKVSVTIKNSSGEDVKHNYDIQKINGLLVIDKAIIKITADSGEKEYTGASLLINSYTLEGSFPAGEGFSNVSILGTWQNVGTHPNKIKGYDLNNLTNSDNYRIITTDGLLEIIKRKINKSDLEVAANDKIYNGDVVTTGTIRSNRIVDKGIAIEGTFNFADKDAGVQKTVNVTKLKIVGPAADNYELSKDTESHTAKANINPAKLTITANNQTKVYGELVEPQGTEFTQNGLITGEVIGSVTLKSAGFAANANANEDAVKYDITASNPISGTDFIATNYEITYDKGALTVSTKSIDPLVSENISVGTIDDVVYNGKNQELKPVVKDGKTTLILGTDYTLTYTADTKNVDKVNVTITGKGNYSGETQAAYNITQATLTITADQLKRTVGDKFELNGDFDFVDEGLQEDENGEEEAIGSVTLTSEGADINAIPGDYVIKVDKATGGTFNIANYLVKYVDGKLTVNAKSFDGIRALPLDNVVYNWEEQKQEPKITDDEGSTLILGTDYTLSYSIDTTNVGEVIVKITGINNYSGEIPTTYKITPAEVIVTYNNLTRHIGAKNSEIFTNVLPVYEGLYGTDNARAEGFFNVEVIVDLPEVNDEKNNYSEYAAVGIFKDVLSTEFSSRNYTFKISAIGNAVEVTNTKAIFSDFTEIPKVKTETIWLKTKEDKTTTLTINGKVYRTEEEDNKTDKNEIKVNALFDNPFVSGLFSFELQEKGGVKVKAKANLGEAEIKSLTSLLGKRFEYEIELWDLESQSDFEHSKSPVSKDLLKLDLLIGNVTADDGIVDLKRLKQDLIDDGIRDIQDGKLSFYKEIIEWDENLSFIQQDKDLLQELVDNANNGKWSHISEIISGWNLISSPLDGTILWNCNNSEIFGDIWDYDREKSIYNSFKRESNFEMIPGVGYWAVSTADRAIIMSGTRTQNAVVGGPDGVTPGWNLIGPVHNYGQLPEVDLDRYIWKEILYSWEIIKDEFDNGDLNNDRNYAYTEAIKIKLAKGYFGFMIEDFSEITVGEIWATQTAVRVAITPTKLSADKDITAVIINLFDLSTNKMHFYKKHIALSESPLETMSFAKANDGRYRITVGNLPVLNNNNYQLDVQVVFANTAAAHKEQIFFKTYTRSEQALVAKFAEKIKIDEQIRIDKNFGNDDGSRFYTPNLLQALDGISVNFQAPKDSVIYEYSLAIYDTKWKPLKRFSEIGKVETSPITVVKKLALPKNYIVSFTVRYKSAKNIYSEYKTYEWNVKNGIITETKK